MSRVDLLRVVRRCIQKKVGYHSFFGANEPAKGVTATQAVLYAKQVGFYSP